MTTTWPKWGAFSFASKLLSILLKGLGCVYIFDAICADFKVPMQNWERAPALWEELHKCSSFPIPILRTLTKIGIY